MRARVPPTHDWRTEGCGHERRRVEDGSARDEFDGRRPIIGICHGMEFMSDVPTLSIRDGILDIGTMGWHRGSLNMQSRIRRCVCSIHPSSRPFSSNGDSRKSTIKLPACFWLLESFYDPSSSLLLENFSREFFFATKKVLQITLIVLTQ